MDSWTKNYSSAAAATYVTGTHTFKAGINYMWGDRTRIWPTPNNGNISAAAVPQQPIPQVVVRNTPIPKSRRAV